MHRNQNTPYMKKFLITAWEERNDNPVEVEETITALSPESALKIFLHNNQGRPIKRGKNSITVKQIN